MESIKKFINFLFILNCLFYSLLRYIPKVRICGVHHVWILLILVVVLLECIWLYCTHSDFITWEFFNFVEILTSWVLTGFHTFCICHKRLFLCWIGIKLIIRQHILIIDIVLLRLIISTLSNILIWSIWVWLLIRVDGLIECIGLIVIESWWLCHTFMTVIDHHLFNWDCIGLLSEGIWYAGRFLIVYLIIQIKPILIIALLSSGL